MNILVLWLLAWGLLLLSSHWSITNAQVTAGADAIKFIQGPVKNTIEKATEWATKVAFGIVGLQAFYVFVIKFISDSK